MQAEEFLQQLHFDIDKAKPADWEADWEDAPLPYKLYRGLPVFPLSAEVPLSLEGESHQPLPGLTGFGHFLWYAYGIAQMSRSPTFEGDFAESLRRVVPSGGGLYPSELYVYLKLPEIPAGIYHYDAAHHRLILLREGLYDNYLNEALGNRCRMQDGFGAVFISAMFWKNFFKYHNFSYRLQGLDAGVLIGQLLETAKRFRYPASVFFLFLDRAVNRLLGIEETEESIYAVIPLLNIAAIPSAAPPEHCAVQTGHPAQAPSVMASDLSAEVQLIRPDHYVRSRRIRDYPALIQMNEASIYDTTEMIRANDVNPPHNPPGEKTKGDAALVALPAVRRLQGDFAVLSRNRYSPETDFILGRLSKEQLAALLQEAVDSFSYCGDLDGWKAAPKPRLLIYGCFYGIDGIEAGAYRYDRETHSLTQVNAGDHRTYLQYGMTLHNVNLFQVPICLHVAGDRSHHLEQWGIRGYRMQQMEAGMLVQRILLAAAALGLGGRPLLGFDAAMCDELYRLVPSGLTALIQIPVGHFRFRSRFESNLHR